MKIHDLIQEIRDTLIGVQNGVLVWFDKPLKTRQYVPHNGGWSMDQILEHITLTSHFLLILIDKGTRKALENVQKQDLQVALEHYVFERKKLDEIGVYQSFEWIRPEHMEPTGQKSEEEIRSLFIEQIQRCLTYLDQMPDGEGVLYKTTMTVNNLGKINVYEYIYFLAKHAERHIGQMERNEREYEATVVH
ncbi:DinB family protein [Cytophagaceae bacterium DM2B3-1]|uniref:DinB family protein n=1 Tax=Xanthocytophaga flava TaxID=3048013 RepID=A0ABT7CQD4_9BACT|nr:DinB family protein [Xanthocytophaga flavus]MDJ1468047.1 DinB family protein [Xanthocytophaga flavus]MDJ1495942.1 DinB family protein [Xanthocytophaga flavus]